MSKYEGRVEWDREKYERHLMLMTNGIMSQPIGSNGRRTAERTFDRIMDEMVERFPIQTYTIEWLVDGKWMPISSQHIRIDMEVAELRKARVMEGYPLSVGRIVPDGVR